MSIEKGFWHKPADFEELLYEGPTIVYSPRNVKSLLELSVSYDRVERKLVNLAQYVGRNLTAQAFNMKVMPEIRTDLYPAPSELSVDEAAEVSIDFYTGLNDGAFDPTGFSAKNTIDEIKKRSAKGISEIGTVVDDRQFIVDLVARGKMRVDENDPNLPDEPTGIVLLKVPFQ